MSATLIPRCKYNGSLPQDTLTSGNRPECMPSSLIGRASRVGEDESSNLLKVLTTRID